MRHKFAKRCVKVNQIVSNRHSEISGADLIILGRFNNDRENTVLKIHNIIMPKLIFTMSAIPTPEHFLNL